MAESDEETLPPSAQCSATCLTTEPEECPNYGIPYETTVYELADGSLSQVVCGACDERITQVIRIVQDPAT
ncbi:hypothetical protein [Streptomyces sp. NPDC016172]|uniref:hypothetical protein n=1 Tax=Streptomyces sp. NPDC016172 TaxID=3364964 RepID=UPI003702CD67